MLNDLRTVMSVSRHSAKANCQSVACCGCEKTDNFSFKLVFELFFRAVLSQRFSIPNVVIYSFIVMKRVFVLLLAVYFASCRVLFPRIPDVISRDSLIPDECELKTNKKNKKKKMCE